MNIKKIVFGAFAFLFIFLSFSCNMGMSDEMYYRQQGRKSSSNGIDFSDEVVSSDDDEETPAEGQYDPFKDTSAWNDINYQFDGNVIGDYIFKVSFDNSNIPTYEFVKKNGIQWAKESDVRYFYNGTVDGNKAQGYDIDPAKFYRYNGYNPLSKKAGSRMARFQFYALLNSKAVVAELNQYLIAVDTYSKLIFAYGKITDTKYISVASQTLPTKYDAVDNYPDKTGEKRKFYEYDPIGALKEENGKITVRLYGEYISEMKRDAISFFPQVRDADRDIATYDKEGRSPYFFVQDLSSLPKFLQDVSKKTYVDRPKEKYSYQTKNSDTGGKLTTINTEGFGLVRAEYEFGSDGKSLAFAKKNDRTGKTEEELTYTFVSAENDVSATYKCSDGTTVTFRIDGSELRKDGTVVGDSNFKDPGADFILRVRGEGGDTEGRKYAKYVPDVGKSVVYQFSKDGGSVTTKNMTGASINDWASGSGTYYFVKQKDGDSEKALYQWYGGEISFGIIPIYTNPYYGLNLSENDTKVQRTRAKGDTDPWRADAGLSDMITEFFSGESEVGELTKENIKPDQEAISVTITAKSVKNVNMLSKDIGFFSSSKAKTAYMINVMRGAVYSSGQIPPYEAIAKTKTSNGEYEEYGGVTGTGSGYKLDAGSTENYNKTEKFDPIAITDGGDVFIELDTRVWLYNIRLGFIETATDPIKLADYGSPVIKFKYDKATKTIKFDSVSSNSGVTVEKNWFVDAGVTKDFVIKYETNVDKKYNTNDNTDKAKCEVTYSIEFKID